MSDISGLRSQAGPSLIDIIVVTALIPVGIPGLKPLPLADTLAVIGLSAFFCFVVNDAIKYFMIRAEDSG